MNINFLLFSPLTWIIVLAATGYFFKKKVLKRTCYVLAVIIFLLFSSPALFSMYAGWYQPEPVDLARGSHYSFAIVPGGFGSVDVEGNGYFNASSDRFLQAVRLYKIGAVDHILISGGNSKRNDREFREGAWARQQMLQFGIPGTVIFVEDRSESTADNAMNSKVILDSLRAQGPYLLVTSAFHMPRAKRLYEKAGMQVVAYPCNYTEGRGPVSWNDLIPSFDVFASWSKYIRQTIGGVVGR